MAPMTDDTPLMRIGELARRTGLSVRTIRFYADAGVVPEAARSEAGYRLFDAAALARLELVRTLRELDVDLESIRRLLAREASLDDVLATHAAALDAQMRVLRLRRGVLRAVMSRPTEAEELELMHRLATLSADERRRIVTEFVDETFAGVSGPAADAVAARMRAAMPDLPEEPTPEQVAAWVELAELIADPAFRAAVRAMAERGAESTGPGAGPDVARLVAERAGGALAAGLDPASAEARVVVDELAAAFGQAGADRAALADAIEAFTDRRVERYWRLLAVINGWPAVPETVPAWEWLVAGLRARPA